VNLVIKVLKPSIVEFVMLILGHIELVELVENHSFKVRVGRALEHCKVQWP